MKGPVDKLMRRFFKRAPLDQLDQLPDLDDIPDKHRHLVKKEVSEKDWHKVRTPLQIERSLGRRQENKRRRLWRERRGRRKLPHGRNRRPGPKSHAR